MRQRFAWCLCLIAAACGSSSTATPTPAPPAPEPTDEQIGVVRHGETTPSEQERFELEADALYDMLLANNPSRAVSLGYHRFDGQLPDVSSEALAAYVEQLERYRDTLASFDDSKLSRQARIEREVMLAEIAGELFQLVALRSAERNPMGYLWAIDMEAYASREYAPAAERAAALAMLCKQSGPYLTQARDNLDDALPRTFVDVALMQTRGLIEFARGDATEAFAGLEPDAQAELEAGLEACVSALREYETFLTERAKQTTDDFRLGEALFLRMLRDTEALDIDLARLTEIGEADLARNLAALEEAAKQLAPKAKTARAVARVQADKPKADQVIPTAEEQAVQMRQFLIDRKVVSIPTDDVAEVRETPPFMRFNFAFLSGPGPFEEVELPSFYYISPPDPTWPKKVQRDYIPFRTDLLFTTIHELWPGHFLHGLHNKQNPSKILKSFCSYAMSEGWAHYTEEMMYDAGVGNGDPAVRIGMLQNALLRNVRFMSALGLHTGDMTVAQSKKMFLDKAHADEGNARQQAVRGTFDPGYLNYTLGKLMIRKLHDDYKAAKGDQYSMQAFHDEFLSYGCAPIPVIRRFMLGADAGPAL